MHHFLWRWRKSISCVFRLLVKRSGKNSKQPLEGCPIGTLHGSVERLFHAMVARNIFRVHAAHGLAPLGRSAAFNRKSLAPFASPAVERQRVLEEPTNGIIRCHIDGSFRQIMERQGKVGCVGRHATEQIVRQFQVT